MGEEDKIVISTRQLSPQIMRLVNLIKTENSKLTCYKEQEIHMLGFSEIFYIDTVDNKVFIYASGEVFESKQKLYELEERLTGLDFLRVSKSTIINMRKIKFLSPALSGRFEAVLKNDERVIISRGYVPELKERLGIGGQNER